MPGTDLTRLSAVLRAERDARGLTDSALAREAGRVAPAAGRW